MLIPLWSVGDANGIDNQFFNINIAVIEQRIYMNIVYLERFKHTKYIDIKGQYL